MQTPAYLFTRLMTSWDACSVLGGWKEQKEYQFARCHFVINMWGCAGTWIRTTHSPGPRQMRASHGRFSTRVESPSPSKLYISLKKIKDSVPWFSLFLIFIFMYVFGRKQESWEREKENEQMSQGMGRKTQRQADYFIFKTSAREEIEIIHQ